MDHYLAKSHDQPIDPLTQREREILVLLSGDKSNQEIADQLFLALSSVKWFIGQIYQKLGVNNRRSAILRARDLGLFDEGAPPSSQKHNLPVQLTSFIGREQETAQVVEMVQQHALVTLAGPGGVGKTRLALAAAGRLASQSSGSSFKAGVRLVELAPVTNPELVPQAINSTLGLQTEPDRPVVDTLCHWLKNRNLLLLLDNCEHLVEACADLSKHLLQSAPGLKVLATSREALGVTGEVIFRVPSLSLPPIGQAVSPGLVLQTEAGRLFMERARAVLPNFEIDGHSAEPVAHICKRLDGIPLAIELAAARLAILDVEQIAARLDHSFRILTGNSRASLERHRTLRAAIEWSYDLLNDKERRLFQRLAVFVGGWALEAAEAVCAGEDLEPEEVFDILSHLVNKSLVQVERQPGRETRYRMLEAIRQYASEKLSTSGEGETLRSRHCAWFEQFVETCKPKLRTKEMIVWLRKLDAETDNLRAVLEWSLDEEADPLAGVRIANNLTEYWNFRNRVSEGYRWLEKSLEAVHKIIPFPLALQVKTLNSLVILFDWWAKPALATERLNEVLKLCETLGEEGVWDRAEALTWQGFLEALNFGNLTQGLALLEESEVIYRKLGKAGNWDLTAVVGGKCYIHLIMNKLIEAQSWAEEGWALAQEMDPITAGRSLTDLGDVAFRRGDFSQSRGYYDRCLALFQEAEHEIWIASIYKKLGTLENAQDQYGQARFFFQEALKIFANSISLDNGSLFVVECMAINEVAWAASIQDQGHLLAGARLMGLDERLRKEIGLPVFIETRQEFEQALATLQEQLDPHSLASAWAEGCGMSLEQAVDVALETAVG